MRYYSFAGLNVSISGMENADYFCTRLSSYETAPFKYADITVLHSEPYRIREPVGRTIAQNGLRRLVVTPDGGYKIYDFLPDLSGLMACVTADREWKSITTQLLDTVAIGGSPNDLRCFNMMGDLIRLMHGGMMLHASAINYNGQGVAFLPPREPENPPIRGYGKSSIQTRRRLSTTTAPQSAFYPKER